MVDPCIHEQDWGMVKEAVPSIKEDMKDIVQCQNDLKRLISSSGKTMIELAQKVKDIPTPNALRLYAITSGSVVALIAFAIYKAF
jgi:hypothetical protein